ncbi:MAG: DUF3011 domain-containing protein [Xanthomonadales bacterium]|nr:DUF3011 domain-containing protein [Xanthomonadales bacterium]
MKPALRLFALLILLVSGAAVAQPGDWRPGPDWDRDINVRCGSNDYRYRMCQVDTGRGSHVSVDRQISDTRCIEGRTWGWNRAGIWVDGGCEAIFRIERRWGGDGGGPSYGGGGDWRPGPDWDRGIEVRCGSDDYRYRMCQVDTGRGSDVRIARQVSRTACIEGRTWGWNRAGIWVDGGCEAVFSIERRWR